MAKHSNAATCSSSLIIFVTHLMINILGFNNFRESLMYEQLTTQKHNSGGSTRGGAKYHRSAARGWAKAKASTFPVKTGHKICIRENLANGPNKKLVDPFETKKLAYSMLETNIHSQSYELYTKGVHDLDPRVFGKLRGK